MAAMTREQRLTLRLMQYWNLIRRDRPFPAIEQFNPLAVGDIWPECVKLRLNTRIGLVTFLCDYMGESLSKTYGRDMTGAILENNVQTFPGVVMYSKLNEIVANPAPMENNGHMLNEEGGLIKYRACFLPFCSEIKGLTHIIVGLSFRLFH